MKKIYELTITAYVLAETAEDARAEARSIDTSGCDVEAYEVSQVPQEWMDCMPFGGDEDKTCAEILAGVKT